MTGVRPLSQSAKPRLGWRMSGADGIKGVIVSDLEVVLVVTIKNYNARNPIGLPEA